MTHSGAGDHTMADYGDMLAIGLGGTGVRAVRTMLAYGETPQGDQQPHDPALQAALRDRRILTVGIDTDPSEFGPIALYPEIFPRAVQTSITKKVLPASYPRLDRALVIKRDGMNAAIRLARNLARQDEIGDEVRGDERAVAELIREFLPIREKLYDSMLPSDGEAADGAGQLRALGRVGFLCGMQDIMSALVNAKSAIGGNSTGRDLQISVFCSLAGGTGSGMLLDTVIMLRRLVFPKARISAFLLMPELFEDRSIVDRIWPNTYAALKEISWLNRPQNSSPVRLNYRINSADNTIAIQKGDGPLIDDIYLFDEASARLDWDIDTPERAKSLRPAAAARAMADAALSLVRRDVINVNKNRQNLLVGHAIGTEASRRFYHSVSVASIMPRRADDLSAVLMVELWSHFQSQYLNTLPVDVPLPAQLRDREAFRNALSGDSSDADPEPLWKKSLIEFEECMSLARAPIGAGSEWPHTIRKDLFALEADFTNAEPDFTDVLERLRIASFLRPAVQRAAAVRNQKKALKNQEIRLDVPATVVFREVLERGTTELRDFVQEVEATLKRGHYLTASSHEAIDTIRTSLRARTDGRVAPLTLSIPAPIRFFQLASPLAAALGDAERAADARRRIELYGVGPFRSDVEGLLRSISSGVANEAGELLKPERFHETMSAAVDDWLASGEIGTLLEKLGRLQEVSNNNKRYADQIRRLIEDDLNKAGGYTQPNRDERERFELILEPLRGLFAEFDHIGPGDEASQGDIRHHQKLLERRNRLEANLTRSVGRATAPARQKFVDESLISALVSEFARPHAEASDYPDSQVYSILTRVLYPRWFGNPAKIAGKENRQSVEQLRAELALYRSAVEGFLDYFLRRPEFELSRLGGEEGIERTIRTCDITPFAPCTAPGALHARYATVSMPALQDGSDEVRRRALSTVHRVVQRVLGAEAIMAPDSSAPVLLYENRYHAAYQLKQIARYQRAYDQLSEDERPLYHVLPGAEKFPPPASAEAIVERSSLKRDWTCRRHGAEPYLVPDSEIECPRCRHEYEQGTRRLRKISRNPADSQLRWPNPKDPKGAPILIPNELTDYFWDGVPDDERSWQKDRRGVFEEKVEGWIPGNNIADMVWRHDSPPRLLFPAVPNTETRVLEWVRRGTDPNGNFVRFAHEDKPLFECYHCGFPIHSEQSNGSRITPTTCPRCRRTVLHCYYCSDNDRVLFQPRTNDGQAVQRCPRCSNTMSSPDV